MLFVYFYYKKDDLRFGIINMKSILYAQVTYIC